MGYKYIISYSDLMQSIEFVLFSNYLCRHTVTSFFIQRIHSGNRKSITVKGAL